MKTAQLTTIVALTMLAAMGLALADAEGVPAKEIVAFRTRASHSVAVTSHYKRPVRSATDPKGKQSQ